MGSACTSEGQHHLVHHNTPNQRKDSSTAFIYGTFGVYQQTQKLELT